MLKGEAMRSGKAGGSLTPPIHSRLMGEINNVSISIKRLFAYRYQVNERHLLPLRSRD